jgi:CheY-like chemotaxis protein
MADILVIERDPAQRDRLARWLARGGHWVVTAADGAQGLTYARTAQFDLIVLDMPVPAAEGLDMVRRLRAAPTTAETRVLALIASSGEGSAEQCRAAGCDDAEPQPLDLPRLQAKILALCADAPVARGCDPHRRVCS